MISLSSVLRDFTMGTNGHVIGTDSPVFDTVTDRIASVARSAGYDEGFAAGMQEVASTLAALEQETKNRVAQAIEGASAEMHERLSVANDNMFDLATAMARAIVGEFADEVRDALFDRVKEALAQLDDEGITVHLSPTDHPAIEPLLPHDVQTVANPNILPGDARIEGRWSKADVSLQTAWSMMLKAAND